MEFFIHIFKIFICFSYFCTESSLLCVDLCWLWRAGLLSPVVAAPHCRGFSRCRALAVGAGSVAAVCRLQSSDSAVAAHGLAALRHVASSRARDWTRVCCIGRQVLIHCTTREALFIYFGCELLIRCMICKYLFPFSRLPSHFLDGFLCTETFSFDVEDLVLNHIAFYYSSVSVFQKWMAM